MYKLIIKLFIHLLITLIIFFLKNTWYVFSLTLSACFKGVEFLPAHE